MTEKTVEIVKKSQEKGYSTIAIICRTAEETLHVQKLLERKITIQELNKDMEEITFSDGVMVLPIHIKLIPKMPFLRF